MCCVLCVGGVIKGPMPPAPCPQPHAPSPMPPTPCLSRRARRAHSHGFKHVTKSIQAPSPMPHAPSPHASRGEQRAPGLHACEMTLSQCPHAPSPRIQWGWGQLARIQMCAPSPILPGAGGMGPSPFAWIHPPCPMLMEMIAIDAVLVIFPPPTA